MVKKLNFGWRKKKFRMKEGNSGWRKKLQDGGMRIPNGGWSTPELRTKECGTSGRGSKDPSWRMPTPPRMGYETRAFRIRMRLRGSRSRAIEDGTLWRDLGKRRGNGRCPPEWVEDGGYCEIGNVWDSEELEAANTIPPGHPPSPIHLHPPESLFPILTTYPLWIPLANPEPTPKRFASESPSI